VLKIDFIPKSAAYAPVSFEMPFSITDAMELPPDLDAAPVVGILDQDTVSKLPPPNLIALDDRLFITDFSSAEAERRLTAAGLLSAKDPSQNEWLDVAVLHGPSYDMTDTEFSDNFGNGTGDSHSCIVFRIKFFPIGKFRQIYLKPCLSSAPGKVMAFSPNQWLYWNLHSATVQKVLKKIDQWLADIYTQYEAKGWTRVHGPGGASKSGAAFKHAAESQASPVAASKRKIDLS